MNTVANSETAVAKKDAAEKSILQMAKIILDMPGSVIGDFSGNEEFPVQHHFANGVYCRQTFLPKGSTVIGRKHRFPTNNILASGKIVTMNPGVEDDMREAPCVFQSPAGTKRAVHALEDTMWITTHPIDPTWTEDDLDKIEAFIAIEENLSQLEDLT